MLVLVKTSILELLLRHPTDTGILCFHFHLSLGCCCWVTHSCPTLCNPMASSRPALCPAPSHKVYPSSCPLHWWWHPVISSSDALFSFCPQSFPASGAFPMSQLFASNDQNTRVLASVLILPTSIQGWFPFCPRDSQESSPAPQFEGVSSLVLCILYGPALTTARTHWENHIALIIRTFVSRIMSLLLTHCLGLSYHSCQEANVI